MKIINNIRLLLKSENFYSLAGNLIIAIFGLINFSLMAKGFKEKEDFGEWILFITANSIVEMIRIGLCRSGFIKFYNSCSESRKKYLIGSTYQILIASSLFFFILLFLIKIFFNEYLQQTSFSTFFQWYLFLTIANIPFIQAQILLQAKSNFKAILKLRFINLGLFSAYLGIRIQSVDNYDLNEVVFVYILTFAIASILSIILKYDGFVHILKRRKNEQRILLRFGFYNVGTQLGSSLLKSSDAFCLGLFACMGTSAVAIYGVAYKMVEIIEIPVRSFSATVFPKLSAVAGSNKILFSKILYQHVGFLTILLLPVLIISYFFATDIVLILGGEDYAEAVPIFRVFILFGLFIPFDRLTGVALDSLNMPKINLYKVLLMLFVNVIGNIAVILIFCNLLSVAFITIITVIVGAYLGYFFLKKVLKLKLKYFITEGLLYIYNFIKSKGEIKFG